MESEMNSISFERVGLLLHIIEKAAAMGQHGTYIVAEANRELAAINDEAKNIQADRRAAAQAEINAAAEAAATEQVGEDDEVEDEDDTEEEDDE